jgi:putative peptide zinc metalloprotease protein
MNLHSGQAVEPQLPTLRQDLRLLQASADQDGAPRWAFYDSLRNKYFHISKPGFELIKNWEAGITVSEFMTQLKNNNYYYEQEDVTNFIEFLISNDLTLNMPGSGTKRLIDARLKTQKVWWKWLIHNYLFIRIPLFRPDVWLTKALPLIVGFIRPATHYTILALGVIGLLNAFRQWDTFMSTFMQFFSWQGMLYYGIALVGVKIIHELGHAFAAKYYGCRVGAMGLAFLVLFPMLYTDTTDSWRLSSTYQRLQIVLAGMRMEFYLALLATFMWAFLPEGSLKSAAFFVATISWISSLIVNATPFLRFDGYFAMSDASGMTNFQERGFAVGRWYLRKHLLGWHTDLPEPLRPARIKLLIIYAWTTWVYRLILFIGIAVLVYNLAFKVLGIVLAIVELVWFIGLPIWREVKVWLAQRKQIGLNGRNASLIMLFVFLLLWGLWPRSIQIYAPAILTAENHQTIYAPFESELQRVYVKEGDWVEPGTILAELRAPSLELERQKLLLEYQWVQKRIDRVASSFDERVNWNNLLQTKKRLENQLSGLDTQATRLILVAELAGRVVYQAPMYHGQSLDIQSPLFSILGNDRLIVVAYIVEEDFKHIRGQDRARFMADFPGANHLFLTNGYVAETAVTELVYLELASDLGGRIPARQAQSDVFVPEKGFYEIHFNVGVGFSDAGFGDWIVRSPGLVVMDGKRRSWIFEQSKWLVSALIRESGF